MGAAAVATAAGSTGSHSGPGSASTGSRDAPGSDGASASANDRCAGPKGHESIAGRCRRKEVRRDALPT
jgi:hypothetical protein